MFRRAEPALNFGKRLAKTPKLDLHDTGLAAWRPGCKACTPGNATQHRPPKTEPLLICGMPRNQRLKGVGRGRGRGRGILAR